MVNPLLSTIYDQDVFLTANSKEIEDDYKFRDALIGDSIVIKSQFNLESACNLENKSTFGVEFSTRFV